MPRRPRLVPVTPIRETRTLPSATRWLAAPLRVADTLGGAALSRLHTVASILSLLWATGYLSIRPASWTPPVRLVMVRQLFFTAVDAVPAIVRFGIAAGILLIVQALLWSDQIGVGADFVAPFLWRAVVRELGPLLACLVVIGRSGVAISTELASMVVADEFEVLEAQGIDPMTYLIMPRIISIVTSVFCLAVLLTTTMLITGFAVGWAMGAVRVGLTSFLELMFRKANSLDLLFFVSKTLIAGGFAGAICCQDGVSVRGTVTDVARVSSRSVIRALSAVLAVSAFLSVLIYGRILVFKIG
ncbi:ABC transporter permease [Crateriforma spongiae]|uniref:ABC transporter permease n=1 Tax=Crateriforma spongiae TaxID=2724528 RepID=UPI0014469A6D|nr:ABC transporter permease [Crateriforma spongiae]